jgi:hypothetical protein
MDFTWINLDKKWIVLYMKKYLIEMENQILINILRLISYYSALHKRVVQMF